MARAGKGTPSLRHDWLWPLDRAGLVQHFLDLGTGWFCEGFGHPNAYPMTYPVLAALTPVVFTLGSHAALVLLVALLGFAAVSVAEVIAARFAVGRTGTAAVAVFLLFNPWVYNKVVAGHLTQTLAYLGIALVACSLLEERPRYTSLALALVLTALQLQFYIVACVLTLTRVRQRPAQLALLTSLIVFSPTIIGVLLDRSWLLAVPFTLPWEEEQSVPFAGGIALGGYFLGYADKAFTAVWTWPVMAFGAFAAAAAFVVRRRGVIALAAFGLATLIFVTGTTGWLAAFWRWAILRAPAIGVFREMYDLVAVVAVVYAVLTGALIGRLPWLSPVALACAIVIAAAWLPNPPSNLWVAGESLPAPGPRIAGAERYALMPPFQPTSFDGHGSGADPLYAGRAPGGAPANALEPLFPEDRALENYWLRGDSSLLERLGVSLVECRRGISSTDSFFHVRPGSRAAQAVCSSDEVRLDAAAPVVAFERGFHLCSLCADAGAGNVFFGDEPPGRFTAVALEREHVLPAKGWVDARLVFSMTPALAQGIGGSFTTQSVRPLDLPPGPSALVNVKGTLLGSRGQLVARDTNGYRWVALPPESGAVTCLGACLVVGVGEPGDAPLEAPPSAAYALRHSWRTAWFISVDVPARQAGLLRAFTTYDSGWTAFRPGDGVFLRHVRVDRVFNGWIVTGAAPTRVWLFHYPSVLQAIAAAVGTCCAFAITALEALRIAKGIPARKRCMTPAA